jgi:hypothetical protein
LVESPISLLRIGASCAVRSSISAWIAGSGVRADVPRLVVVGGLVDDAGVAGPQHQGASA